MTSRWTKIGFRVFGILLAVVATAGVAAFLGLWIPNAPSRSRFFIRGIDVSHHNGSIVWSKVRESGVLFAYIKATEGTRFKDPNFASNWSGAKEAGVTPGGYHFFALGVSGEQQAANFIATVPLDFALPPAIDLEFSGANAKVRPLPRDFQREFSIFWDAISKKYACTPIVYTVADFREQYLKEFPIERLWIREVIGRPPIPWVFWQFSSRGRVPGIAGHTDLNVFNGDDQAFAAFLGMSPSL